MQLRLCAEKIKFIRKSYDELWLLELESLWQDFLISHRSSMQSTLLQRSYLFLDMVYALSRHTGFISVRVFEETLIAFLQKNYLIDQKTGQEIYNFFKNFFLEHHKNLNYYHPSDGKSFLTYILVQALCLNSSEAIDEEIGLGVDLLIFINNAIKNHSSDSSFIDEGDLDHLIQQILLELQEAKKSKPWILYQLFLKFDLKPFLSPFLFDLLEKTDYTWIFELLVQISRKKDVRAQKIQQVIKETFLALHGLHPSDPSTLAQKLSEEIFDLLIQLEWIFICGPEQKKEVYLTEKGQKMTASYSKNTLSSASDLSEKELAALGLRPNQIFHHQKLIEGIFNAGMDYHRFFTIKDTCRLNNGRIIPLQQLNPKNLRGIFGFVPAAGASSRYCQPIRDWYKKHGTFHDAPNWLVPAPLDETFENWCDLPKALMPCKPNKMSYLEHKALEHRQLDALNGQIFIVPFGQKSAFDKLLKKSSPKPLDYLLFEQGPGLSTIRFLSNGQPFRDKKGQLSMVPAGHGAILNLMPEIKKALAPSESHSIFIRNIDNIPEMDEKYLQICRDFMSMHCYLLEHLKAIRVSIKKDLIYEACSLASRLMDRIPCSRNLSKQEQAYLDKKAAAYRPLWELLVKVFQLPHYLIDEHKDPSALLFRPLNTMGMVANTGKDFGGCPATILSNGQETSICIEAAHVSKEQQEQILKDPLIATHFNPVFVLAEIPEDPDYYSQLDQPFWILAEKYHEDQKVVYFETVLYELISNAQVSNTVFVDVPRVVFKPHKSIDDL